ncbi:hypothetical protein GW17_00010656 [Ensete ventricosum]|nr:hypothetical protein GW17_00010656 [Ensete ventricosum]
MKDLCGTSVRKDDEGYYALYMSDLALQDPNSEMRVSSDKELNDARGDLSNARRQLKEAWVKVHSADDDLLKSIKEVESARAELSRRAIDDYKSSTGFKEGLKRMDYVSYEYLGPLRLISLAGHQGLGYWCAHYSISGTVMGGRSISDQKNLDGLSPIKNA